MALDYEMRKLSAEAWKEQQEVDQHYIDRCKEEYEKAEELGNKHEANFNYWVLGLVDRLEEAAYEWQELKERERYLEHYIEDWVNQPNLGKHFDERY